MSKYKTNLTTRQTGDDDIFCVFRPPQSEFSLLSPGLPTKSTVRKIHPSIAMGHIPHCMGVSISLRADLLAGDRV